MQSKILLLIATSVCISFLPVTDCNSEARLAADTRKCKWKPPTALHDSVYTILDTNLAESNRQGPLPKDEIFRQIDREIEKIENRGVFANYNLEIAALRQLKLLKTMDTRSCLDHCTYVLARINCNAGKYQHACLPRSRHRSFLKTVIDGQVFPLIERCYSDLVDRVLVLNSTAINPREYEYVSMIAKQITHLDPAEKWSGIDDIIVKSSRPFFAIRRLFKPIQAGFFANLSELMQRLERLKGGVELMVAVESESITKRNAFSHYERWVLQPCADYINKMHKAVDAVMFYGKLIELSRSKFRMDPMDDAMKVKLHSIIYRYHACVYLENHSYADKTTVIKSLLSSGRS